MRVGDQVDTSHWRAVWLRCMLALLCCGVMAVPLVAQDELPGNDPAAWLEEASVQARRISGVGDELTDALQIKGELLAFIAASQDKLGQTDSAEKNQRLVNLCIRALAHDGEDGWVRVAQARAVALGSDDAAAALQTLDNPTELAALEALAQGEALDPELVAEVSPGFARQLNLAQGREWIRQNAETVALRGSLADVHAWVDVLSDPAERAWASLGVARGLALAAKLPKREPAVNVESVVATEPEVITEPEPVVEAEPVAEAESVERSETSPEATADDVEPAAVEHSETEPEAATESPALVEAEPEPGVESSALPEAVEEPASEPVVDVTPTNDAATESAALSEASSIPAETSSQSVPELVEVADTPVKSTAASPSLESTGIAVVPVPVPVGEAEQEESASPEPPEEVAAVAAEAEIEPAAETGPTAEAEPVVAPKPVTEVQPTTDPEPDSQVQSVEESVAVEEPGESPPAEPTPTDVLADTAAPALVDESPVFAEPEGKALVGIPVVPDLKTLADPALVLDEPPAPDQYDLEFVTTKGAFTVRVHRDWAPLAADRFYDLSVSGFYHNQRVFRVVEGFVVQWGIHGYPDVAAVWRPQTLKDEPRTQPNKRGTIAFAAATQPHTRATQVFINLDDNAFLDELGFVPFGEIVEGLDVVESLFGGYGETPSTKQRDIQLKGNAFLDATYPELDSILSVQHPD